MEVTISVPDSVSELKVAGFWQWLQTPDGLAAGTLVSMFGLIITLIGFAITLWRIRSWASKQERIVRTLAGKILEYQVKELQRILRLAIRSADTCKWETARDRCEEAQILAERLIGNPFLESEEKNDLLARANDLQLVARYIVKRKLKPEEPSAFFDPKKLKVFRDTMQIAVRITQRLEEATWSHMR